MQGAIRLGRIFGIRLAIDWTWFPIAILVTWNLTAALWRWHPDWGPALSLLVGIIGTLLLFASVVAHELAHSLMARAQGIAVHDITLFLFGGVSNLEHEPDSPRVELLSAIVGPATSLVLGVLFLALGALVAGPVPDATSPTGAYLSRLGPVATLLLWLGPLNLGLGIFNLVPGFPLDGGRVLRAALWAKSGDLQAATRRASRVGQAIGWLFVALGAGMAFGLRVPWFGTGVAGGLWLAFIGWFLTGAAAQSYRQVVVQEALRDVTVRRLMSTAVRPVPVGTTLSSLVEGWVVGHDEGAFPVLDDVSLRGLVTLDDLRTVPRRAWPFTPVEQVMTPADRLLVVAPDTLVTEALAALARRDVEQAPVIEDGRLLGLLRQRDVALWLRIRADGPEAGVPLRRPTDPREA